jgi:hypothetical protein
MVLVGNGPESLQVMAVRFLAVIGMDALAAVAVAAFPNGQKFT